MYLNVVPMAAEPGQVPRAFGYDTAACTFPFQSTNHTNTTVMEKQAS